MPQPSRKLQKLISKAFPKPAPSQKRKNQGINKFLPGLDPNRFQVFWRLKTSSGHLFAGLIIILIVIAGLGFGSGWEITLAMLAGTTVCLLMAFLVYYFYYLLFFRPWQQRLPFALSGWERLVNRQQLCCDLCWSKATVSVTCDPGSPENWQTVAAALKLFCDRANHKFYSRSTEDPGSSMSDPRQNWDFVSDKKTAAAPHILTVTGSACPEIVNVIRNLLRGHLSLIARELPGLIEKVDLEMCDSYHLVDIDASYSTCI